MPAIPGNDLEGVISFRDIVDVNKMIGYGRSHKSRGSGRRAIGLGGR